ncbi:phosphopyruvate hydratase [Polytolypa hystricis UAMH7299]|uniref:Enolase n=1 Tax=Polytolypa hystricis (strain UAMH7299) TaxID=1447883 RepID=A0A2B7Y2B4_POLH7|nr:phosphopyruvate hydratase [Polytolypa hystricis UAMH7299]
MIRSIHAAQRLDSRGNPTVQVDVTTDKGTFRSLVPSGASTGSREAVELRDTSNPALGGKGVHTAVRNVEKAIAPHLIAQGFNVETDLDKIDDFMKELDGTKNKSKLGANAILGVSMACARAGAASMGVPLYEYLRRQANVKTPYIMPVPFFNVLNGGVHSGNAMAFQEFMIAPVGAESVTDAIWMAAGVYHELKKVISTKFGTAATGIGDEGGFAPPIVHPHEALDLLTTAIANCGYTGKVQLGIDPAASEFFRDGNYDVGFKDKTSNVKTPQQMRELYQSLLSKYPIVLLEDPFAEDDWQSWIDFNKECNIAELVGDDLLVTNVERVQEAHEKKACDAMLLKVNQIGTVTEAIAAAKLAYKFDWGVFVSHRSGETTDDFIADLVVGLRTGHLKSGAPCRGERVVKYNRLMDIEAELKAKGEGFSFAGSRFRKAQKL